MVVPPYSIGVVVALVVLVVCIVGLLLVVGGVAFGVNPLVAVFVLGAALAVARLT